MPNIIEITAVVTSVDIGTPQEFMATPLLGGAGREALIHCPVLPLTSTVLIQGAPAIDASTGIAPVEGSSLWTTRATFTSSADQIQQIEIDELMRWNTTVLDADGPDVKFVVQGVQ